MDLYHGVEERFYNRMLEPLGRKVKIYAYVDENHTGNQLNRRSHSGIIIYVNNETIIW